MQLLKMRQPRFMMTDRLSEIVAHDVETRPQFAADCIVICGPVRYLPGLFSVAHSCALISQASGRLRTDYSCFCLPRHIWRFPLQETQSFLESVALKLDRKVFRLSECHHTLRQ
jgi:hypothetical protein